MVRPFVRDGKPKPARLSGRIDDITADDLRLLASVKGKGRYLECVAVPAEDSAVAFVEPFRRGPSLAGTRFAALNSYLEHAGRVGFQSRRAPCIRVHLLARLHAARVRQAGSTDQD